MRSFKNTFFFLLIVIAIGWCLNFLLVPSSYLRVILHEIQSTDQNYNMVVVGQSHGETDINPYILEEKTGYTAYNMSRRLVSMTDLYYIVKESNYRNKPKVLVLDLDSTYFQGEGYTDYFSDSYIYPHMNNPRNRIEYFLRYNLSNDFRVTLCRYSNLKDGLLQLPFTIRSKTSKEYWDYDMNAVKMHNDNFVYKGRGFRYGIKKLDTDYVPATWSKENVSEKALESFQSIVEYCKKENIQLICISSPVSKKRLQSEPFEEIHHYFEDMTEEYEVPYFDFNFIDPAYLEWSDEDFADMDGHMMGEFAEEYSRVLGKTLKQYFDGKNVEQLFTK